MDAFPTPKSRATRAPRMTPFSSQHSIGPSNSKSTTMGGGVTWSRILCGFSLYVLWCSSAAAQYTRLDDAAAGAVSQRPTPIEDDAGLFDIQFVGSKSGWIVGEHGVVWRTTDGGQTWLLSKTPVDCTLRDVCFLSDRVGWVVGGGTKAFSQMSYGVVLRTQDGGQTWEQLAIDLLPALLYAKFFDLQHGVAVGAATTEHPTGMMVTDDGGTTWRDAAGPDAAGWWSASFLSPEAGVVVGPRGRLSLAVQGRLLASRQDPASLRGFRAISIGRDDTGWLAGDGGRVLMTTTGGASWQSPPGEMPPEIRDLFDFRAVTQVGKKAWIAGRPGSAIWHTADEGRTWKNQRTGHPAPINALEFTSEDTGWAAGALGTILHTDDGGYTWHAVRGGGRRLALMAAHARPRQISFSLMSKYAEELGYRSAVWLASQNGGVQEQSEIVGELRVSDAVATVGGSAAETEWRFPIDAPGLDRDKDKLVSNWNLRHEGRFTDLFLTSIVRELRMWRPSVLVLSEPPADDAVSNVLYEGLLEAVKQAADPTRFPEQADLAGLEPWQVGKVYVHLPEGSSGNVSIDAYEFLPRLGTSLRLASAEGYAMVRNPLDGAARTDAYRLVVNNTSTDGTLQTGGGMFSGLGIIPDSEARREMLPLDEDQLDQHRRLAALQRNVDSYADKYFDDPRHASQIMAQFNGILGQMPDEQGAMQLAELANNYRRRSQWELVETTFVELVKRYPHEPPATEAMRWLFQYWASSETNFQRLKKGELLKTRIRQGGGALNASVDSVTNELWPNGVVPAGNLSEAQTEVEELHGSLMTDVSMTWEGSALRRWHDKAISMAKMIRTVDPALYRTSEIQFPLASLVRKRGGYTSADSLYQNLQSTLTAGQWQQTAESELWLTQPSGAPPKTLMQCRFTAVRPVLDGLLSDPCWHAAQEIHLTASADAEVDKNLVPLVMLAYDTGHLYVAASIPRNPAAPDDKPELSGRTHDADLSGFDRVSLYLDVDRDYATYYAFHVDQRGWTSESCWDDEKWNPDWYVAASADGSHWRAEIAIPLEHLVPPEPLKQACWAVAIVRTIPTVGVESWTHPAGVRPDPETFGLVRFD